MLWSVAKQSHVYLLYWRARVVCVSIKPILKKICFVFR